jgi:RimJ/RimL family protein N-acetyltransferase
MEIIKITNNNLHYLQDFIKNKLSKNFRYFDKRNISVFNDHFTTLVGIINNKPIAYGHIDFSKGENMYWLGICILDDYHGKGYGKQMMDKLIEIFNNSNNINKLYLTVDKDNLCIKFIFQEMSFYLL